MVERDAEDPFLEVLPRSECLRLLGTQVIGRVAVAEYGGAPLVVPVNFLLDEERIHFRTDYGTKFRLMVLAEAPVSFEVDHIEPGKRAGWSVLVQGRASEVEGWDAQQPGPRSWAPGDKAHWVQLVPDSISGRRLHLPGLPDPLAGRGYL